MNRTKSGFKETMKETYYKHAVRFSNLPNCFRPEGWGGKMPTEAYLFSMGIAQKGEEEYEFQDIRVYFKRK
jgi:hypothetical protein